MARQPHDIWLLIIFVAENAQFIADMKNTLKTSLFSGNFNGQYVYTKTDDYSLMIPSRVLNDDSSDRRKSFWICLNIYRIKNSSNNTRVRKEMWICVIDKNNMLLKYSHISLSFNPTRSVFKYRSESMNC